MTVRDFKRDDLPAICEAWNETWPHIGREPDDVVRDIERLEERFHPHFLVAERDGAFLGFAEALRPIGSFHPQRWTIHLVVLAPHRRQGVGTALYQAAADYIAPYDPIRITTSLHEEDEDAQRFAKKRNFVEHKRDFESRLPLDVVDQAVLEAVEARGLLAGITLASLKEVDSIAMRRAFHQLFEEVRKDVPRSEPPTPMAFEFFDDEVLGDPSFMPEGTFLALDSTGEPIGFCGVFRSVRDGCVEQWLTATRRDWRGQGLAAALKVRGIRWAMANGVQTILTDNDTRNTHMLAINDRLGFQRQGAILTVVKDVTA